MSKVDNQGLCTLAMNIGYPIKHKRETTRHPSHKNDKKIKAR